MLREIPLTRGMTALVDDGDFEMLSGFKWHATSTGYAARSVWAGGRKVPCYMHRMILLPDPGQEVDHINRDPLDNRRSNLRTATSAENRRNTGPWSTNTSGYKGVYWFRRDHNWTAHITKNYHAQHLGYFDNARDAALAYDAAARDLFGEFAWVNFPC